MDLVAQKELVLRQREIKILKELRPNQKIIECEDWDCTLMEMIQSGTIDFLFLDINVLGLSWTTRLKDLLETLDNTRLILTAEHIDSEALLKAFKQGLWSFIPTSEIAQIGKEIFNLILSGGRYFPSFLLKEASVEKSTQSNQEALLPSGERLTKRQREVLGFLQEGLSNKQIAGKMNISEPTVKLHIHGLFHKLHAINRTQIVLKAAGLGLN